MPYSTRNGLKIWYEVAGEGEPMVFVHANPFDHRLWLYQIAHFSQRYRTIAVDMRGYGRSDKSGDAFTLADMANDVLGVCDDEGVESAIFCGCSTGSGISLLIGEEHPERVRALILVGGSTRGPTRMQKRIDGFLSDDLPAYHAQHLRECLSEGFPRSEQGAFLLWLFEATSGSLKGPALAQIFRARMTCDLAAGLSRVRAPTLIVNGEFDNSLASGRETAARLEGSKHVTIADAGHACNIEKPAQFNAAVTDFLAANGLW